MIGVEKKKYETKKKRLQKPKPKNPPKKNNRFLELTAIRF